MRRLLGLLQALAHDRRGMSAVELALIAPFLIALMLAIPDVATLVYGEMAVQDAAHAGAVQAVRNGFDATAIGNAVVKASDFADVAATPAPVESCGCVSGTALLAATCGDPCPDGSAAGTYVTVSATAPYAPLFAHLGLPLPAAVTARALVRVK